MSQLEMFAGEQPAPVAEHGGYIPPAADDDDCQREVLKALQFYHDENDMGWEPASDFDALQIAAMVTCHPEGPFCIAVRPVFHTYSVSQIYVALSQLADIGEIHKETRYFGSRSPAEGNYRGYGYRYSLPEGTH